MMSSNRGWWLRLPEPIRQLPADLAAVIILTLLTVLAVSLPGLRETPLQIILGLPFVLFLPGYVFVTALFPECDKLSGSDEGDVSRERRISPIERVALAFGTSIAIVPLIGLALNYTPWGIRPIPITLSVSIFTIGSAVVAAVRRWELAADERFSVPYREWVAMVRAEIFEPGNRIDTALNVALALSLILAFGSIGFAAWVPQPDEQFTEFYLLTEDDGDLVADNYPEEFVQNEARSVIVGIENQEHETVEYTAVVQLEQIDSNRAETKVIERDELTRFNRTLEQEETWHVEHEIVPTMVGEDLRLTYLLYKGEPPEEPTKENSYRHLHLWITVENTEIQDPIQISDREINNEEAN